MKNIFLSLATIVAVLSFVACETDLYEDSLYIKGDKVEIVEGETIVIRDTVYVEKIIEIVTEKGLDFECFDFKSNGNIEGHSSNHAEVKEFSYNLLMDVEENIFFSEQETASFEVTPKSANFEKSMAQFYVGNGVEQKSVIVSVPGSNSVIINSKEIYPCKPFRVTAEISATQNRVIDGKEYEVAKVTYTFFNGKGEEVKSVNQNLYAPIKKKVNERTITITHRVENKELIIEGRVDNTLEDDVTAIVKVPLMLEVKCENKKIIEANNFAGFSYGALKAVSKNIVKEGLTSSANDIFVTYNQYDEVYSQNVTASGNNVEVRQTVRYYNEFVAEFYGEKYSVSLPVDFAVVNSASGEQIVVGDDVRLLHTINYKASTESMDAVGSQDIEVVVNKSHLNEQTVTITHRFENNFLVIEGNVDNTMFEDINAVVRIPLKLTVNCENKKTVYSNSLNGFTYNPIHEASKVASQSGLTASSDGISVTYNEYESVYSHNVTASGNNVEVKQTLRYYNEFVAEFYGKEYPISLPLSFIVVNSTTGNQKVVDGKVSRSHFINYQASIASLNVTDSQEIEVIVNAISFDGQRVEEAYRTLTFKDHNTPLVYDCVLTRSTNSSDYYFNYREIVNNMPQAWSSRKLTSDEYNVLVAAKTKAKTEGVSYALTIYYSNAGGMDCGYLYDRCPTEVLYYAISTDKPRVSVKGSRFVFLGDLNTAIAGSWVKEGDMIKLDNVSDIIYNNTVIARGDDVYFY